MVQVLETEIWDEANQTWKARGERWTTAEGQVSAPPSDVKAPEGFEFEGEWKIVVSSGDSMGWEYEFQYLRPPKRKRTWLRSLKQSEKSSKKSVSKAVDRCKTMKRSDKSVSEAIDRTTAIDGAKGSIDGAKGNFARGLSLIRDDFNFKGFGLSIFKSLIFPESLGLSLRLPLSNNFDTWDRHPELPTISTSVSLMFPWTIAVFCNSSVRVEWLKWAVKRTLQFIPRLIIHCVYEVFLPSLWAIAAAMLSLTSARLPPIPKAPTILIAKPRYNPEISERVGCSLSYRWSRDRGFQWRVGYWHSYLPTLVACRKLLQMKSPADWWQKHFGSVGLSTSYPIPVSPGFSCSAQLSLSGLYFERKKEVRPSQSSRTVHNAIAKNTTDYCLFIYMRNENLITKSKEVTKLEPLEDLNYSFQPLSHSHGEYIIWNGEAGLQ
ncbi:unnamed protein product [Cylindrotheca closterium]|uniref:Uncharacterized protein n=1 Tax=Cylindrotheca closterium TaxID=2856 RepID=A0AAD2FR37_9STRA|nr:unnamed protein product [Cylindrotheca closterium]